MALKNVGKFEKKIQHCIEAFDIKGKHGTKGETVLGIKSL